MRRTMLALAALALAPTAQAQDAPAAPNPGDAGPRFELRPGERHFRIVLPEFQGSVAVRLRRLDP